MVFSLSPFYFDSCPYSVSKLNGKIGNLKDGGEWRRIKEVNNGEFCLNGKEGWVEGEEKCKK